MKNIKQFLKGFTLVELIIVITILAILGTIGFVSFQNYITDTRDSKKMSSIKNIEKWIITYQIKVWNYPEPDNKIDILWISYQWYVWAWVEKAIQLRKNQELDQKEYIYSLRTDKLKYQLWVYLENSKKVFSLFPQLYASSQYENKYLYTIWDLVWIIIQKDTNIPVQDIFTWSLNLNTNTWTYIVKFNNSMTTGAVIIWSGSNLLAKISDTQYMCQLSGNCIQSGVSCNDIKIKYPSSEDGIYWIDPDGSQTAISSFQVYCDMTTDGGGWTLLWSAQVWGVGINPISWTIATDTSITSQDPLWWNTIWNWWTVNSKLQSWNTVQINSVIVREGTKYDKMLFTSTNNFSSLLNIGTLSSYTNVSLNFNTCNNSAWYCWSPSIQYALRTPNNQPCSNSYPTTTSNNQGINLIRYHDSFCSISWASYANRWFFVKWSSWVKEANQSFNRISNWVSFWWK